MWTKNIYKQDIMPVGLSMLSVCSTSTCARVHTQEMHHFKTNCHGIQLFDARRWHFFHRLKSITSTNTIPADTVCARARASAYERICVHLDVKTCERICVQVWICFNHADNRMRSFVVF
jgi:hypothetical protein